MKWLAGAAAVSGGAAALLAFTAGSGRSNPLPQDQLSAISTAAPAAVAALVAALAAFRARPLLALIGGGVLFLPCLFGGALAMILSPSHDDKWICVWAGAASAAAALALVIGGALARRRR